MGDSGLAGCLMMPLAVLLLVVSRLTGWGTRPKRGTYGEWKQQQQRQSAVTGKASTP